MANELKISLDTSVESDRNNFEFKYTIVAKRKGYEDKHIDEYKGKAV